MDDLTKEYNVPIKSSSMLASSSSSLKLTRLNLDGHSCTNCNLTLLQQLRSNPYIDPDSINLEVLGQIQFLHEDMDLTPLLLSIEELGYKAVVVSTQTIISKQSDIYGELEEELNLDSMESNMKKLTDSFKRRYLDFSGTFHPNHLTWKGSGTNSYTKIGSYNQIKSSVSNNNINSNHNSNNSNNSVELSQIVQLKIDGMTCSACVHTIETSLLNRPGILKVDIQLLLGRATVEFLASKIGIRQLLEAVQDLGYNCELIVDTKSGNQYLLDKFEHERIKLWFQFLLGLIFVIPSFVIDMCIGMFLPRDNKAYQTLFVYPFLVDGLTVGTLLSTVIATGAFFVLGSPFFLRAFKSLKYTKSVNMDSLISLGALTAYVTSLTLVLTNIGHRSMGDDMVMTSFEVIPFLFTFLLLGKYLETLSKQKTLKFITNLLSLSKATARRVLDDGTEQVLDIQLVQVDDILRVKAGEKIPCDGVLIEGSTSVDESMLTGESKPINKSFLTQDPLLGGSINLTSSVLIKVIRVGQNTVLNQIVTLAQNAQASKADIEILADKLASRFAPVVILFAILTILIWLILGWTNNLNITWLPHGYTPTTFAIFNGVSTLIVACPCALGLASPTAVMVGTGLAAKYGLIVRGGGKSLEVARRIDVVVFDKTGTLTEGQPIITDVKLESKSTEGEGTNLNWPSDLPDETNLWRCILELESKSNHPMAKAIVNYANAALALSANEASFQPQLKLVTFEEFPGLGLVGKLLIEKVKDGDVYEMQMLIGSANLLKQFKVKVTKSYKAVVENWSSSGKSVAYVATTVTNPNSSNGGGKVLAVLAAEDAIRKEASHLISTLKSLQIEVWMLTGDKLQPAQKLGKRLGIDNVIAGVLPNEKGERVKWLQSKNSKVVRKRCGVFSQTERNVVAMVGDGINDSVALAQADIGIAMGQGTDLALNTADCILLRSRLTDLLTLLQISKATYQRIQFNFLWAFGYNLLALPLAAGLTYPIFGKGLPPALAGILMVVSSLSVMISSIMLGVSFKPLAEKGGDTGGAKRAGSWDEMIEVPKFALKSKEKWRLRTLANNLKVDFSYRELK